MPSPDVTYEIANYFVTKQSTVRKTAQHFGVSKSTVYLCVSKQAYKQSSQETER